MKKAFKTISIDSDTYNLLKSLSKKETRSLANLVRIMTYERVNK